MRGMARILSAITLFLVCLAVACGGPDRDPGDPPRARDAGELVTDAGPRDADAGACVPQGPCPDSTCRFAGTSTAVRACFSGACYSYEVVVCGIACGELHGGDPFAEARCQEDCGMTHPEGCVALN